MDRVDPNSPVPVYHQIVEEIRYRLATGQLKAGQRLPPVRTAASQWGVHLHTVRRAYAELQREGLIEIRRPTGTWVLPRRESGRPVPPAGSLDTFLDRTILEARDRFGLPAEGLAAAIAARANPAEPGRGQVSFVECNTAQAEDYARQLEERWRVEIQARCLDQDEPGPGMILSTFFHYNEVRRRWPHRARDLRFLSVRPDPDVVERIRASEPGDRKRVVLCEVDATRAQNIAADLSLLFPAQEFDLETKIVDTPGSVIARARHSVLFAPRIWAGLSAKDRNHPKAYQLRYVIEEEDARLLGREQCWRPRTSGLALTPTSR